MFNTIFNYQRSICIYTNHNYIPCYDLAMHQTLYIIHAIEYQSFFLLYSHTNYSSSLATNNLIQPATTNNINTLPIYHKNHKSIRNSGLNSIVVYLYILVVLCLLVDVGVISFCWFDILLFYNRELLDGCI